MSHPARRVNTTVRSRRLAIGLTVVALLVAASLDGWRAFQNAAQAYPRPNPAPVAWEIDMTHRTPQRIVVDVPGRGPVAYWYMVYTVTNNTDEERFFLPDITLHTQDGKNLKANHGVPGAVYDRIRDKTKSLNLVLPTDMVGRLLVGEDEAKSSMAVWEEPKVEIGTFDIFFAGLSGEVKEVTNPATNEPLKDSDGKPILIRKTRQLTFKVRGDDKRPEQDRAVETASDWVMR